MPMKTVMKKMVKVRDPVWFQAASDSQTGYEHKTLYIAGHKDKKGGRWYAKFEWSEWMYAPAGSKYAPAKPKKKDNKVKKAEEEKELKKTMVKLMPELSLLPKLKEVLKKASSR